MHSSDWDPPMQIKIYFKIERQTYLSVLFKLIYFLWQPKHATVFKQKTFLNRLKHCYNIHEGYAVMYAQLFIIWVPKWSSLEGWCLKQIFQPKYTLLSSLKIILSFEIGLDIVEPINLLSWGILKSIVAWKTSRKGKKFGNYEWKWIIFIWNTTFKPVFVSSIE